MASWSVHRSSPFSPNRCLVFGRSPPKEGPRSFRRARVCRRRKKSKRIQDCRADSGKWTLLASAFLVFIHLSESPLILKQSSNHGHRSRPPCRAGTLGRRNKDLSRRDSSCSPSHYQRREDQWHTYCNQGSGERTGKARELRQWLPHRHSHACSARAGAAQQLRYHLWASGQGRQLQDAQPASGPEATIESHLSRRWCLW